MRRIKLVRPVLQMEVTECGAASLAMILSYHGCTVPIEQLRRDCGVSRNGVNAKNIALAAKLHGLDVTPVKAEPDEFEDDDLPGGNLNINELLNSVGPIMPQQEAGRKRKAAVFQPLEGDLLGLLWICVYAVDEEDNDKVYKETADLKRISKSTPKPTNRQTTKHPNKRGSFLGGF